MDNQNNNEGPRFFSIRTKLILITSIIIGLTSSIMIVLAVLTFKGDNEVRIQESNLNQARIVAKMLRNELHGVLKEVKAIKTLIENKSYYYNTRLMRDIFFTEESNIAYVGIMERSYRRNKIIKSVFNDALVKSRDIDKGKIQATNDLFKRGIDRAFNGEDVVLNASIYIDEPILCIVIPLKKKDGSNKKAIISYVSITKLLSVFKTKDEITNTFIVNKDGDILAHSNPNIILSGGNYLSLPIVKMMKKSPMDNGHAKYINEKGISFLGSFMKIGFADIGVIASAEEEKVYRSVYKLQNIYIYITVIILTIAIMVVYLFCKNITEPIKDAVGAVKEIENGDFHVKIAPKTNDEIGVLTTSIIQMGQGLEEREFGPLFFGR